MENGSLIVKPAKVHHSSLWGSWMKKSITQRLQLKWWVQAGDFHTRRGRGVSIKKKDLIKVRKRKCCFQIYSNFSQMNEQSQKKIMGWVNIQFKKGGLMGVGVLPDSNHRKSHTGRLVSPTDRPTISAMTANRINRANARMMYFCK